jgi:hypothetical protein
VLLHQQPLLRIDSLLEPVPPLKVTKLLPISSLVQTVNRLGVEPLCDSRFFHAHQFGFGVGTLEACVTGIPVLAFSGRFPLWEGFAAEAVQDRLLQDALAVLAEVGFENINVIVFVNDEGAIPITHVVPIWPVEVVRPSEADVRVTDDSRVVQVVWAGRMWQKAVQNDHVALLCYCADKFLAFWDVLDVDAVDRRVEAFRVAVDELDDAWVR